MVTRVRKWRSFELLITYNPTHNWLNNEGNLQAHVTEKFRETVSFR